MKSFIVCETGTSVYYFNMQEFIVGYLMFRLFEYFLVSIDKSIKKDYER